MTQLLLENLNPVLINQLETLAKLHGRSLQEEIKHILQQAAQSQLRFYQTESDMAKAREAVARSRVRYAGRTFSDSAELIREDRDRLP